MAQCVVIADDLTGANATGVLCKKANLRAATILDLEILDEELLAKSDCIIYPTDSRSIDSSMAYKTVYDAVSKLKSGRVKVYSKRIDSTLRGNLGSETDAFLDGLGDGHMAIVVPCFPEAKRIVSGGYLLVDTVPLHKTAAAKDPKNPVQTSLVKEIFARQSKNEIESLMISDIMRGKEHISNKIHEFKNKGVKVLIFDCISREDIEIIAEGVVESKVPFIAVDPGTFTAAISQKLIKKRTKRSESKILVAIGTTNEVARLQVNKLLERKKVLKIYVKTKEFVENQTRRENEIKRIIKYVLNNCDKHRICTVIGDGIMPKNWLDLDELGEQFNITSQEVSRLINDSIAEIIYGILSKEANFKGLYSSGGDITVAINKRFGTSGILLKDEVLPLAAYGQLFGGDMKGLKVITKGGMAGEEDSIIDCINYLEGQLDHS